MSTLARALTTMIAATVAPVDPFISMVACILRPSLGLLRRAFSCPDCGLFAFGVEHERGEQERQVDDAHLEQITRVHLRLDRRAGARDASETNGVAEIDQAE